MDFNDQLLIEYKYKTPSTIYLNSLKINILYNNGINGIINNYDSKGCRMIRY